MSEHEKRKHHRVDYNIEAELVTEGQKIFSTQIQNISMDGLYLITNDVLPVGAKGQITIALKFGKSKMKVKADCVIVRSEVTQDITIEPRVGVKFTSVDPDSSIVLYNMIKYQTTEFEE